MQMRMGLVLCATCGLVLPAGASAAPPKAQACAGPPSGWVTSRPDKSQVVNTIVIYDKVSGPMARSSLPTWNGSNVHAGQLREYVTITKQMTPVPTLLLIVSPHADCEEVQFVRKLVGNVLDCGTDQCVEVAP